MCTIHTRESQSSVCVSPYHRQSTITQFLKDGNCVAYRNHASCNGPLPQSRIRRPSSRIKSSARPNSTKSPNHSMVNTGRDFWWPRSDSLSKQTERIGFYTCWQSLQGLNWCLQKEITIQPTAYHHHWCTNIFRIETPTDNFHLQILSIYRFKNIFLYSISWH